MAGRRGFQSHPATMSLEATKTTNPRSLGVLGKTEEPNSQINKPSCSRNLVLFRGVCSCPLSSEIFPDITSKSMSKLPRQVSSIPPRDFVSTHIVSQLLIHNSLLDALLGHFFISSRCGGRSMLWRVPPAPDTPSPKNTTIRSAVVHADVNRLPPSITV